jgi:splicing factor 3B subunit 2
MDADHLSKRQRYRERRKAKRGGVRALELPDAPAAAPASPPGLSDDPDFAAILARFAPAAGAAAPAPEEEAGAAPGAPAAEPGVSRQLLKRHGRPTVGLLKSASRRPELVEPHDADAPDPFALAALKNARNIVPVPGHWSQKRRYLNYKRGSELSRYRLPAALERTGIAQMRQAVREADERRSLQARQRDRARPKLGLFEVAPAQLHEAFFRRQRRPPLTRFADVYFEGREAMPAARGARPGRLSQRLREALGMVDSAPPPWLARMQKYGPPPSYPGLRIPGLNAPLPPGCEWGHHIGGWGQVPLDAGGNPYWGGNPFAKVDELDADEEPLWGQMAPADGIEDGVNV